MIMACYITDALRCPRGACSFLIGNVICNYRYTIAEECHMDPGTTNVYVWLEAKLYSILHSCSVDIS